MTPVPRMLLAPNPGPMTLDGTRTFIVGRERPVVIDPGPDEARHLQAVVSALDGAKPVAVLLTHHHGDHSAGAAALAARTGAPLLAAGSWPGAGLLEDGARFDTDQGALVAVATPGHSPVDVSFHWPEAGAVFVGDTFMGEGDTTLVAPPEGDLADYLASLDRLEGLQPRVLYPAHGPPLEDAPGAIARFRQHRQARIAQLLDLLRGTSATPAALVDAVHGSALDPRLRSAAAGSLQAILHYLEETGRAVALPDGSYTLNRCGG